MTLHDSIWYYSIYRRHTEAHGSSGIGIGLLERFSVRIFASPRRDMYMSRTVSLAECYRLARALRKVLFSLEPWDAHLSRVLGAVRIALERAEVRRPIPRTSIQRVEEGRVDRKHVEELSQHLECTWNMLMAPGAEIPMLARERKAHRCQKSKKLSVPCTREFAVLRISWRIFSETEPSEPVLSPIFSVGMGVRCSFGTRYGTSRLRAGCAGL